MATIAETENQIQTAKSQANLATQNITQYKEALPPTMAQKLLRAVGYSSPLQAQQTRTKIEVAKQQADTALKQVGDYQGQVEQYSKDFEAYKQSDPGRLQYAKESGLTGEPVYDRIVKGGSIEVVGYKYNTPMGEVTDYSPRDQLLQQQYRSDVYDFNKEASVGQALGFTNQTQLANAGVDVNQFYSGQEITYKNPSGETQTVQFNPKEFTYQFKEMAEVIKDSTPTFKPTTNGGMSEQVYNQNMNNPVQDALSKITGLASGFDMVSARSDNVSTNVSNFPANTSSRVSQSLVKSPEISLFKPQGEYNLKTGVYTNPEGQSFSTASIPSGANVNFGNVPSLNSNYKDLNSNNFITDNGYSTIPNVQAGLSTGLSIRDNSKQSDNLGNGNWFSSLGNYFTKGASQGLQATQGGYNPNVTITDVNTGKVTTTNIPLASAQYQEFINTNQNPRPYMSETLMWPGTVKYGSGTISLPNYQQIKPQVEEFGRFIEPVTSGFSILGKGIYDVSKQEAINKLSNIGRDVSLVKEGYNLISPYVNQGTNYITDLAKEQALATYQITKPYVKEISEEVSKLSKQELEKFINNRNKELNTLGFVGSKALELVKPFADYSKQELIDLATKQIRTLNSLQSTSNKIEQATRPLINQAYDIGKIGIASGVYGLNLGATNVDNKINPYLKSGYTLGRNGILSGAEGINQGLNWLGQNAVKPLTGFAINEFTRAVETETPTINLQTNTYTLKKGNKIIDYLSNAKNSLEEKGRIIKSIPGAIGKTSDMALYGLTLAPKLVINYGEGRYGITNENYEPTNLFGFIPAGREVSKFYQLEKAAFKDISTQGKFKDMVIEKYTPYTKTIGNIDGKDLIIKGIDSGREIISAEKQKEIVGNIGKAIPAIAKGAGEFVGFGEGYSAISNIPKIGKVLTGAIDIGFTGAGTKDIIFGSPEEKISGALNLGILGGTKGLTFFKSPIVEQEALSLSRYKKIMGYDRNIRPDELSKGRITSVTTKFRETFGLNPIYEGNPYSDKAGYEKALSMLGSDNSAKQTLRLIKPVYSNKNVELSLGKSIKTGMDELGRDTYSLTGLAKISKINPFTGKVGKEMIVGTAGRATEEKLASGASKITSFSLGGSKSVRGDNLKIDVKVAGSEAYFNPQETNSEFIEATAKTTSKDLLTYRANANSKTISYPKIKEEYETLSNIKSKPLETIDSTEVINIGPVKVTIPGERTNVLSTIISDTTQTKKAVSSYLRNNERVSGYLKDTSNIKSSDKTLTRDISSVFVPSKPKEDIITGVIERGTKAVSKTIPSKTTPENILKIEAKSLAESFKKDINLQKNLKSEYPTIVGGESKASKYAYGSIAYDQTKIKVKDVLGGASVNNPKSGEVIGPQIVKGTSRESLISGDSLSVYSGTKGISKVDNNLSLGNLNKSNLDNSLKSNIKEGLSQNQQEKLKERQETKLEQVQQTKQQNKQIENQIVISKNIISDRNVRTPNTRRFRLGFPSSDFRQKKRLENIRQNKKGSGAFNVAITRRGKIVKVLPVSATYESALGIAGKELKGSIKASAKLLPTKGIAKDYGISLGATRPEFRQYNIRKGQRQYDPLVLIQKQNYRLESKPERIQIVEAKRISNKFKYKGKNLLR